ncbi:ATP-binding protein [Pseudomonas sp. 43(2021)]|uniref:AAA family ATPase n=1 Tax=Pseudomonas sp. 43(2021) TaxID=2813560 RepID=UPI001A9DFD4B|nr:ATP-binding protein [Pseudomonas sp. 43(2021)]
MLVAFNVGNYRSIKEIQTLSLVRSSGAEKIDTNVINTQNSDGTLGPSLLKSVALYGPNASGKSTLVQALSTMRKIVLQSATVAAGTDMPVDPFALDNESAAKPTMFEVIFVKNNVRYQYGFEATKKRVYAEWLYAFPKGRSQEWFIRQWIEENNDYTFKFGDKLKGQRAVWESSTRPDALFLSTAIQLNSEQLKPVYDWFKYKLKVSNGYGNHMYTAKRCSAKSKNAILDFMKAADFAISDINVEEVELSVDSFPKEFPENLRNMLYEQVKDDKIFNVSAVHRNEFGAFELPLELESDGTRKIFNIAAHWLDALSEGRVLVVDELHERLHPFLVKFLVEAFHNPELNNNGAQLILTTHETSILSQDVFRRDQIWFAERDSSQASKFYPLTDFSPKKGQDNLERSYLTGRYGAVPSIKRMINIFYGTM